MLYVYDVFYGRSITLAATANAQYDLIRALLLLNGIAVQALEWIERNARRRIIMSDLACVELRFEEGNKNKTIPVSVCAYLTGSGLALSK